MSQSQSAAKRKVHKIVTPREILQLKSAFGTVSALKF